MRARFLVEYRLKHFRYQNMLYGSRVFIGIFTVLVDYLWPQEGLAEVHKIMLGMHHRLA